MATRRDVRTVLVVDDDVLMLTAATRKLRSTHVVLTATNSTDAQRIARGNPVDVALVDLRLGDESGLELISTLKAQQPGLIVVCVSSFLSTGVVVDAMKAGASDVVPKTEPLTDVLARIQVGRSHRTHEKAMSVDDVEWDHLQRVLRECVRREQAEGRTGSRHVPFDASAQASEARATSGIGVRNHHGAVAKAGPKRVMSD